VVGTYAPDNGAARGGIDDCHAWLIAIDDDGRRLWQVEVGGAFSVADCAILTAADAGGVRVAAAFASQHAVTPEPGRALLVDGRSGRVLERSEFPDGLLSPHAVDGRVAFVTGSEQGRVRAFAHDLRLLAERRLAVPAVVCGVGDADGDGDPEIVAAEPGAVVVLDRDLRVRGRLAVHGTPTRPPVVALGSAGVGHLRLAIHDGRALVADVHARRMVADPAALAGVGALAALAGIAVPLARRLRGPARRPAGAAAREFLLDYHQLRHETFERARPFARVRLWAQARAVGHLLPGDTLDSACEEFERIGLPTLLRFAERAAHLQVERARVRRIRAHAHEVAGALRAGRTVPEPLREQRVAEALRAIDALAQDAGEAYWEVVLRDPCRPAQVAAEAMLGKREALEQGRITARFEADPASREPVLFDRGELRALVGELVENAARALAGTAEPALELSVRGHPVDPRRIVLTVRDNGPGVAAGPREDAPAATADPRPGGGFGLHRARETAQRWLAELTLEDPPEGIGTEVRLVLRACRIVDESPRATPEEART
jgi:signal transduction histidine kinase